MNCGRGAYCTVAVTAGTVTGAIALPNASVLRDDNNQPFVYVATGANQFGRRDVETEQSENGVTQIVKGIAPGDRVVGDGSLFLIRTATMEASLLRLRPIMMTALVACLGLLPAALSTGIGSDTQKPFAIVIVAGLISRLFLGFFVSPVLYEMVARDGDVLKVQGCC